MTEGELAKIEARLNNWGRWAFSGSGGGKGHCCSAEYRYVPEKLGDGEQAVHRTPMPVDALDAELVEEAVTRMTNARARLFLKEVYVYQVCRSNLESMFRLYGQMLEAYRIRVLQLAGEAIVSQEVVLVRKGKPLWAGVARITRGRV